MGNFPRIKFKFACGASAIRAVRMKFERKSWKQLKETNIIKELGSDDDGYTNRHQMIIYLKRYGYQALQRRKMSEDFVRRTLENKAVIIAGFLNHWNVLFAISDNDIVTYYDGTGEHQHITLKALLMLWIDKCCLTGEPLDRYGVVVKK